MSSGARIIAAIGRLLLYRDHRTSPQPTRLQDQTRRSIMNALAPYPNTERYAHCIKASKAVRWDIDADVIKGRSFDLSRKYLPDGLSLAQEFASLSDAEKRLVSQIQGRTYANIFGLVERFIAAKLLEIGRDHWF